MAWVYTESCIIIILYSETRSRTVFFVVVYNRFLDSSKFGPRDFDPPPGQKIVPAHLTTQFVWGQSLDKGTLAPLAPV